MPRIVTKFIGMGQLWQYKKKRLFVYADALMYQFHERISINQMRNVYKRSLVSLVLKEILMIN